MAGEGSAATCDKQRSGAAGHANEYAFVFLLRDYNIKEKKKIGTASDSVREFAALWC